MIGTGQIHRLVVDEQDVLGAVRASSAAISKPRGSGLR